MSSKKKNPLDRRPLHQQIADILREDIVKRLAPGERLESEAALGKRFGVSVLTVREALSSLAEAGLVVRRHGSGTYVAEPGDRGHLAVLVDSDIANPRGSFFHLRLVQQLRERLEAAGATVRVYVGRGNPPGSSPERPNCPEFNADVDDGLINGIAAVSVHAHPRWLKSLTRRGIAIVGDGAFEHGASVDTASLIDHGIDRLVEEGRRRIAVLGWGGAGRTDPQAIATRAALKRHDLPARDGWIRFRAHQTLLGAGWEEVRTLWVAEREKPDGLLITDDVLFADAQVAIAQLGVEIPKKLMIIAHANLGAVRPPPFPAERLLFDPDRVAEAMAAMLLRLLKQESVEPRRVIVAPILQQPEIVAR
ncbi:MAG: GntR family transcriptional regulator [Planctomycetes bacterium]|nr:GntR family transcriptional regulator [Planctomycetota bacterium]